MLSSDSGSLHQLLLGGVAVTWGSEDALQTGEHSWHPCHSAWQYAVCADAALEQGIT